MTTAVKVVTFVKIVNRKNRKFTILNKFLAVDSPHSSPTKDHCKWLRESETKTFRKGHKN